MEPIRVAVSGALGKMGSEVVKTVLADPELTLVAAIDKDDSDEDIGTLLGLKETGIQVTSNVKQMLINSNAQVCVDFTHPSCVYLNAQAIIEASCCPIIGTTGLTNEQVNTIKKVLAEKQLGGLIAPNFALGAVLLMKFASEASKYFNHAEIIEYHHNQKADAPSGTAMTTAVQMLAGLEGESTEFGSSNGPEKEVIQGARGAKMPGNVQIHSVRLPGMIAHQEVLFGDTGQLLTIRHDSFDRQSFMPGVAVACKKVVGINQLALGLESIL